MSLYTSVCRPLEMAKSYLINPEAVDFCSNNVMNFSGKFMYCCKDFYPCPKSMEIYGEMDRFVFINTLHIDDRLTSAQRTVLMNRLPHLKNVYLHNDPDGRGPIPGGFPIVEANMMSYEFALRNTVDIKNLYERDLDKLEIDYTGLIDRFHHLLCCWKNTFGHNFDQEALTHLLPDKITARNISIIYHSYCYNEHMRNTIVRLLQNMGDHVRTLSIIKNTCNSATDDPFQQVIFGRNIEKLSFVEKGRDTIANINLLGFGNKLEYLSIYPYDLENPNTIIFGKLNYLSIAFSDVNFQVQIEKYSRWFPNIIYLELVGPLHEYETYIFKQSHLDIIENSFIQPITIILALSDNNLDKKITFKNNVVFKLGRSYKELNIKKHTFLGNVSIINDSEILEKYDEHYILSIVKRKDQNIVMRGLEILAEAHINDKVCRIYVCKHGYKNFGDEHVRFHEKTTVFHPNLYTKNIGHVILIEAHNSFKNFSFCNFIKLDIVFRKRNSLNLEITDLTFPNLEDIKAIGINIILCKDLVLCDIKECDVNLRNDVNIGTCYFKFCNISGSGKITTGNSSLYSNKIIDCLNLILNEDACLLNVTGNYGKSIDFSSCPGIQKLKDILIKNNRSELTGEINIINTFPYINFYINVSCKKVKINFGLIKAAIGSLEFVLIGDNISCKSMQLCYFQSTMCPGLFSRSIFIRSKNIMGTLSFTTCEPSVTYIHSDENPIGVKYISDKNPRYYSFRENEQVNPSLLKTTIDNQYKDMFISAYQNVLVIRPGFKQDDRDYPPILFAIPK